MLNLFILDRAVEPTETPPAPYRWPRWPDQLLQLFGAGVIAWGAAVAVPRFVELHPPKPPF